MPLVSVDSKKDITTLGLGQPYTVVSPNGAKTDVTTKDLAKKKGNKKPNLDFGNTVLLEISNTSNVPKQIALMGIGIAGIDALAYPAGTIFAGDTQGLPSAGGNNGELSIIVNGGTITLEQVRAYFRAAQPYLHNFYYNVTDANSINQFKQAMDVYYLTDSGTKNSSLIKAIKAGDTKSVDEQLSRVVAVDFHLSTIRDIVITAGAGYSFSLELHLPYYRFEHK